MNFIAKSVLILHVFIILNHKSKGAMKQKIFVQKICQLKKNLRFNLYFYLYFYHFNETDLFKSVLWFFNRPVNPLRAISFQKKILDFILFQVQKKCYINTKSFFSYLFPFFWKLSGHWCPLWSSMVRICKTKCQCCSIHNYIQQLFYIFLKTFDYPRQIIELK